MTENRFIHSKVYQANGPMHASWQENKINYVVLSHYGIWVVQARCSDIQYSDGLMKPLPGSPDH